MSEARLRTVSELARRWVDEEGLRTIVLVVVRHGVVVLHQAYGKLSSEPGAFKTPLDAIFDLMSITKVFTATALMQLVDEGRVGLNRPVSSYIPEFQGEGKDAVLVRHLLSHTSGLRDEDLLAYAREHRAHVEPPPAPPTAHPLWYESMSLRFGGPLRTRPGEEMAYCSYNLGLAAEVVRRVTGTSLDRWARERIFLPLGMNDSSYCLIDAPLDRRVALELPPGYVPDASDLARERERYWAGSWGAVSSAMDLAIFGQMFLNHGTFGEARVLSEASTAAMTRNQTPGVPAVFFDQLFRESNWGLGWGQEGGRAGWNGGLQSPITFGHLGNGGIHLWVDPERDLVGVFCSAVPIFLTAADYATPNWAKLWRNDLFADAVTASIEEL